MATHSSVLAQRIPWIEETGWLHSLRCKDLDISGWLTRSYFLVFSSMIRICTNPGFPDGSVVKNPLANAGDK